MMLEDAYVVKILETTNENGCFYLGENNKLRDGILVAKLMTKTEAENAAAKIEQFFPSIVLSIKERNERLKKIQRALCITIYRPPRNIAAFEAQIRYAVGEFLDEHRKVKFNSEIEFCRSVLINMTRILDTGDFSCVDGVDKRIEQHKNINCFDDQLFGIGF